ncbi:MAG: thioredoxin fold domain-containing protein [candidate division Zixibacteria bacterium]|nr:thioredoxin fold domain-containing protein [candidate division Zixibacteria bacterium]
MEKGAFSNDQITQYINSKFVPVKVKTTNRETFHTDAGDITTGDLVRRLQIRGVPATYFLDDKGDLVFNVPGYVPDDIYSIILRYVAEEHFKNQSFDEFKKSVQEG